MAFRKLYMDCNLSRGRTIMIIVPPPGFYNDAGVADTGPGSMINYSTFHPHKLSSLILSNTNISGKGQLFSLSPFEPRLSVSRFSQVQPSPPAPTCLFFHHKAEYAWCLLTGPYCPFPPRFQGASLEFLTSLTIVSLHRTSGIMKA